MNLFNRENKVVAAPENVPITEDFNNMSFDNLVLQEKHFQRGIHRYNPDVVGTGKNKQLQAEAQHKLEIVQSILREKIAERENAKKLAKQDKVRALVTENLAKIRITVNPSPLLNQPDGFTISCVKWQTPTATTFTFKAPVKCTENGKNLVKIQEFTFSLLDIPADTLEQMLDQPFEVRTFNIGTQRLAILVT